MRIHIAEHHNLDIHYCYGLMSCGMLVNIVETVRSSETLVTSCGNTSQWIALFIVTTMRTRDIAVYCNVFTVD
jgi:hypothetical protein